MPTTDPGDVLRKSSILLQNDKGLRFQVERLSALVSRPTVPYGDNRELQEDPRWRTFDVPP